MRAVWIATLIVGLTACSDDNAGYTDADNDGNNGNNGPANNGNNGGTNNGNNGPANNGNNGPANNGNNGPANNGNNGVPAGGYCDRTGVPGEGDFCDANPDCDPGLVCVVATGDPSCRVACDTDADCDGEDCNLFSANNGNNGANNGANNGNNGDPGLTCAGVLGCFDTCEGAECDLCFGRVQAGEESDRLQALFACAQVNGCNDDENGDCIGEFCLEEVYACFGYGEGTQECRFFFECSGDCDDDESCEQACLAQLDQEGLDDFFALVECGESSGCDNDYQCLLDVCNDELVPCLGSGCGDMICEEDEEETCPRDCAPRVRHRFAMIEDRADRAGPYPGVDIDAIGLVQGDREHFVAAVEDSDVAASDNQAPDVTQLLGAPDADCDAEGGAHVSLGGRGRWVAVSWGTRDEDVVIRNGNIIRVYELGELLCGRFDNDAYAVSVGSSLDSWIEIGQGGLRSNDIVVSGL